MQNPPNVIPAWWTRNTHTIPVYWTRMKMFPVPNRCNQNTNCDWPINCYRSHALVPINVFANRGVAVCDTSNKRMWAQLQCESFNWKPLYAKLAFILMNEQSCFRVNGFKLCNSTFIVFNKMCPFWHSLPEYPSSTFLYGSMVLIPGATSDQEANWKQKSTERDYNSFASMLGQQ